MTRTDVHQCCGLEIPVSALPSAERFVIWASRVWIEAHCDGRIPCQRLQNMFQHLRLQDCIGPFYSLLSLMTSEATRNLDFLCPVCRALGADEKLMITLLAACQQGATQVADIVLEGWMPGPVARRAAYPARLVAHGMAENGLLLHDLTAPRNRIVPVQHAALH